MSHIEQIPAELTWQIRRQVLYPDKEPGYSKLPDDDEGMHRTFELPFGYINSRRL